MCLHYGVVFGENETIPWCTHNQLAWSTRRGLGVYVDSRACTEGPNSRYGPSYQRTTVVPPREAWKERSGSDGV